MKRITADELQVFLRKHKLWLIGDPNGERADLYGADLYGADLRGADLYGADLRGANLYGADLRGAKMDNSRCPLACPEEGAFIGFKKANEVIVKLLIPENAKRSSATSRKCRCDKAVVLSITNLNGTPSDLTEVCSSYDKTFKYVVGQTVSVSDFDENRWNECAPGIHFFVTRQEAVDY